jgi:hypothetical protein
VKIARLIPVFVEFIPETVEDGKLFISEEYSTAVHNCCCGCGLKVVTPLNAKGWRLTRDGQFITLYPSIGNWSFPCQSHYWIRRNAVLRSYQMTKEEIAAGRRLDGRIKEPGEAPRSEPPEQPAPLPRSRYVPGNKKSLWARLKRWLFG